MRVLFLVEYLKEGGIERILQQMMAHFPSRQVDCVVYAYETPTLAGLGNEIAAQGGTVYCYKKKEGYDLGLVRRLAKVVRDERISVIHTHDFGPTEYAVPLKILFPRLKLIHTQHTLHHFIDKARYRVFLQVAAAFYSKTVCVSKTVEEELSTRCRFLKRKLITVPNGVDTDRFQPDGTYQSEKNGKMRFVNVSRVSPEKNLTTLLAACSDLAKLGFDFELHHVGSGAPGEESKIKAAIKALSLQKHVHLHGFQSDVRPFLNRSDLFISTSYTEGHPVSVLEAMAMELPCCLSDIPPHRAFRGQGVSLFRNDRAGLRDTLASFVKSKTDARGRRPDNREVVLKNYSLHRMLDGYSELYGS